MAFQPMTKHKWMVGGDRVLPVLAAGSRVPSPPDLSCMEDGMEEEDGWDKGTSLPLPRGASAAAARPPAGAAAAAARLPTASERAQLRRARPADLASRGSRASFVSERSPPPEERVATLRAMLRQQRKFLPTGVTGSSGSRARCHGVSPFVAERRGLFVAWENQMATFLGYSRDTVAVALNYFDRYTCATACPPTLAQAVAATALHVAAKFEETQPASLRELLKFTPVFNPEQLLLMEMSLLKVLNWDLRPVTVYDFVRAFCALLIPGAGSMASSASASASAAPGTFQSHSEPNAKPSVAVGAAVTLQAKEDKEKELERLRIGAEDIADLASFDVAFVDFLPSTLATSALLLSVSRGTPAPPSSASCASLPPTSHADVLDACWKGVPGPPASEEGAQADADTESDGGGVPLRRVLDCVQLLGSSLSHRYPTVAAAAESAAEGIARYAGWPLPSAGCRVAAAAAAAPRAGVAKKKAAPQVSTTPVAVNKSRRCATPTGVEGIMHIEMDAIRGAGAGTGGDDDDGDADEQEAQQQQKSSANEAPGASTVGGAAIGTGVDGPAPTSSLQPRHRRRPSAFTTTASATATAAIAPQQQQKRQAARVRADSFAYTDEDIAFARASKRSADALGHSESGSGFGAPASRCGRVGTGGGWAKAAKLSRSPPPPPLSVAATTKTITAPFG